MKAVEEAATRIIGNDTLATDDQLDDLYETVDNWLRRGGCADAVAELLGLLVERRAALTLLVGALTTTLTPRDSWTDELRVARDGVIAEIRRREPKRWEALVQGLENDSDDPGDLLTALEALRP